IPSGYYTDDPAEGVYQARELLETDRPEWNALEEHRVSEYMTRALITLAPDSSVQEAAASMLGAGVRRLLVVDVDRLVGLVSSTDV
ncbi:MAG: CBS domain-containing protein, partial [Gemmatimonadota bacterium]